MEDQIGKVQDCETWEEFLKVAARIKKWKDRRCAELRVSYVPELIFRGQAKSTWTLETTLERHIKQRRYSLEEYYQKAYKAWQEEVPTGDFENLSLPTPDCFSKLVKKLNIYVPHQHLFPDSNSVREWFLYLRHYTFPSPLLDWTGCPYIAAFFAFSDDNADPSEKASIYIFLEHIDMLTSSGSHEAPFINTLGPEGQANTRHKNQQSRYTFCLQSDNKCNIHGEKFFASHQDAFLISLQEQNITWKCNIPKSERDRVKMALQSKGIDKDFLFGDSDAISRESAMKSLADRIF